MQMPLRGEGWFEAGYAFLCDIYGRKGSDEQRQSYEIVLQPFPDPLVSKVVSMAPRLWPEWFPKAPQLRAEVERLYQLEKKTPRRDQPTEQDRPTTVQAQKLIDMWAEEDRTRTMRPSGYTPMDVASRRFRQVWELLGVEAPCPS